MELEAYGYSKISIHALREEGDFCWAANAYKWFISIHALREEGDASDMTILTSRDSFLSTPSARRATKPLLPYHGVSSISIHALREEGDSSSPFCAFFPIISIHALREEGDNPNRSSSK